MKTSDHGGRVRSLYTPRLKYDSSQVRLNYRLLIRRDPDYWARDLPISRGLYNFDEIRIDYFRDATAMFEAFKAGLYDFRVEDDATRWLTGYDFPAARDGRIVKHAFSVGLPKGIFRLRLQYAASDFRRPAGARGAGDGVRFRMDQRQPLLRRLQALAQLLRRQRSSPRRAGPRRRASARCSLPSPAPCAKTFWKADGPLLSSDGSGRDRALARRAVDELKVAGWALNSRSDARRARQAPRI